MNSSLTNLRNLGILCTAAASLLLAATSSHALDVNLAPSDFLPGTLGEVHEVSGDHAIDEASPANGFGKAFNDSSSFLLLGATSSANTIPTDGKDFNNSVAESITFPVTATDISQGIVVDFNWAFNGNSPGTPGVDQDNFSIVLLKDDMSAAALVLAKEAIDGYGFGTESVTLDTSGLTVGNYVLKIALNENSGNSNISTAAGFNQITLENPSVSVPFEFSPSLGLIMMGGLFITTRYAKSRKAKQDVLNI